MNSGKIALGLLAAAATGALLGVIFAPSKGAALRRKIHRMGEKEIDVLKNKFNDFVDSMSHNCEKIKEDIDDLTHKSMDREDEKVSAGGSI
jgi:gas vesicle protein